MPNEPRKASRAGEQDKRKKRDLYGWPGPRPHASQQSRRVRLRALLAAVALVTVVGVSIKEFGPVESKAPNGASVSQVEKTTRSGAERTKSTKPPTTSTTTTTTTTTPPNTLVPLMSEPGVAPVITRVETNDPVVFLTIDDGVTRLPEGAQAFRDLGIPASLFLNDGPVLSDPDYFRAQNLPKTLIESHTSSHTDLTKLSEEGQYNEICGNVDLLHTSYGRRPVMFRPPFGNFNEATKRAAAACGMKAIVLWQENVNNDVIGFREVQQFRPGDIILMHFRDSFVQELTFIKQQVEAAGLRFALLEDYITPENSLR